MKKLKKLVGNMGRPSAQDARLLSPPPQLSGEARREWKRLAQALYKAGLLREADRTALADACQAWGRYVKAEKELAKHGPVTLTEHGTLRQSPCVVDSRDALEKYRKLVIEFGVTPSSR